MQIKHRKLTIPIDILEFALQNKLLKATAIYIFLKFYSDGKVHQNSPVFDLLKTTLNIKDQRTLAKHINSLLHLNWMGFNETSGNYFIRSFESLRGQYGFKKRQGAVCYDKDLNKLESFFFAAIVTREINVQKFLRTRRGRSSAATNKRDVASQPGNPASYAPQYFGLSNSIISQKIGCKKTRASELKKQAAKDGFIKVRKRYRELVHLNKGDFYLPKYLPEVDGALAGRIKFRKRKNGKIVVIEQLYDEIIPKVGIKSIGKIKNAKKLG